jgi:hypothetical protein
LAAFVIPELAPGIHWHRLSEQFDGRSQAAI